MKLLIDTPSGVQEVIEVFEGGGYFDPARVLWDERSDGQLPAITLGGMVRTGETLMFSAERKAQHDAALAPTRDDLKAQRQAIVEAITVTVNEKVFNGDETSQGRMNRALRVADITGQTSCTWVLADNTPATVTKEELAQALALSMQAQADVWVLPA
jgi:hypothetical protein